MKSREKIIQEMVDHFHEESSMYGGWPISVKTLDEALIINEEFKGTLKAMEDKESKRFTVIRKKNSKFADKHTIRVLREKAELYKLEADRFYNGIKKLIDC